MRFQSLRAKKSRDTLITWDDYRMRRILVWVLFLGYLPVVVLVGSILNAITASDRPILIVAMVWMIAFAFAGYRLNRFPCPQCGKPFFYRRLVGHPFSGCCLHCSWPKWKECTDRDRARWNSEEFHCLRCGARIGTASDVCGTCGWAYDHPLQRQHVTRR